MIVAFDCLRKPPELCSRVARNSLVEQGVDQGARVLVVDDGDDELHRAEYARPRPVVERALRRGVRCALRRPHACRSRSCPTSPDPLATPSRSSPRQPPLAARTGPRRRPGGPARRRGRRRWRHRWARLPAGPRPRRPAARAASGWAIAADAARATSRSDPPVRDAATTRSRRSTGRRPADGASSSGLPAARRRERRRRGRSLGVAQARLGRRTRRRERRRARRARRSGRSRRRGRRPGPARRRPPPSAPSGSSGWPTPTR